jgi:hypothetical protein
MNRTWRRLQVPPGSVHLIFCNFLTLGVHPIHVCGGKEQQTSSTLAHFLDAGRLLFSPTEAEVASEAAAWTRLADDRDLL